MVINKWRLLCFFCAWDHQTVCLRLSLSRQPRFVICRCGGNEERARVVGACPLCGAPGGLHTVGEGEKRVTGARWDALGQVSPEVGHIERPSLSSRWSKVRWLTQTWETEGRCCTFKHVCRESDSRIPTYYFNPLWALLQGEATNPPSGYIPFIILYTRHFPSHILSVFPGASYQHLITL